jgi:hypothetical protein
MGEVVLGSLWLYQYSHEHCHCPSHTPLLARLPRPKQSYVRSMSNRCPPPGGRTGQGSVYSATRQLAPHDDSILLVHYFCCIASRNSAFIIYKTSILLLDTGGLGPGANAPRKYIVLGRHSFSPTVNCMKAVCHRMTTVPRVVGASLVFVGSFPCIERPTYEGISVNLNKIDVHSRRYEVCTSTSNQVFVPMLLYVAMYILFIIYMYVSKSVLIFFSKTCSLSV